MERETLKLANEVNVSLLRWENILEGVTRPGSLAERDIHINNLILNKYELSVFADVVRNEIARLEIKLKEIK